MIAIGIDDVMHVAAKQSGSSRPQPFRMIVEGEILADLGMTEIVPVAENRFFKLIE
jgi:hypothetical protein